MDRETIRGIPIFREFSDDLIDVIIPVLKEESYEPGGAIFDEGEVSDRFFIIREGEVEIRKVIDQDEGRFKLIAVLLGGEFFGEMALFLGQPRSATAVAKTAVSLLSIGKADLLSMFARSPETAFKVMGFLTSVIMNRLNVTTKELVTVYETGRLVTTVRSMQDLSECVLNSLIASVENADSALFVIWNEFNEDYEVVDQRGLEIGIPLALDPDDAIIALLNENKGPFVSFDVMNDTRLSVQPGSIYSGGSLVAAPFILHDRLLGFMAFMNREKTDAFSYNHMVLLSAVGGYVSVAIENIQFMQAEIDRARLNQGKSSIHF